MQNHKLLNDDQLKLISHVIDLELNHLKNKSESYRFYLTYLKNILPGITLNSLTGLLSILAGQKLDKLPATENLNQNNLHLAIAGYITPKSNTSIIQNLFSNSSEDKIMGEYKVKTIGLESFGAAIEATKITTKFIIPAMCVLKSLKVLYDNYYSHETLEEIKELKEIELIVLGAIAQK